ncbi:hypothetical protein [Larkinella soli]|uniref:hypothetical protein n=1 Tax=Larkinella soli TaxID=1770527 RepID=UPI000FFC22A3|nr:hypothetical protein [Larkinella soli]
MNEPESFFGESFWDWALRLVKYFSILAAAVFGWYGAYHETRNETGRLTGAGKIVAAGIIVSMLIGLMSQFFEDKRNEISKRKEAAEKQNEQARIDSAQRVQIDRLETLLGASTVTLQKLQKQDTAQQVLAASSQAALEQQNNLLAASTTTLKSLEKQEVTQRELLGQANASNLRLETSLEQQQKLVEEQKVLLQNSYSALYPLYPVKFYFELIYPLSNQEYEAILKTRIATVDDRQPNQHLREVVYQLKDWEKFYEYLHPEEQAVALNGTSSENRSLSESSRINPINEINDQYPPKKGRFVDSVFSTVINNFFRPDYWMVKIYKKEGESWEKRPGLIFLSQIMSKVQSTSILRSVNGKWVVFQKVYMTVADRQQTILNEFSYRYSHWHANPPVLTRDSIGLPTIESLLDLVNSRLEVTTLVKIEGVQLEGTEMIFQHSHSRRLVTLRKRRLISTYAPSGSAYYDDFHTPPRLDWYLDSKFTPSKNTPKTQDHRSLRSDKVYPFRISYSTILTSEQLGLPIK